MKKGFTIVEVLVAVSLFAVAATVATTLMVNVVNLQKKASVQNAVYEDARILMQQLTKEIQGGTIDYEEYYSVNVVQAHKKPDGGPYYGINYGVYGSRFFDPGRKLVGGSGTNPEDLGLECSFPANLPQNQSCEIVYNLSSDFNTGQNPYKKAGSIPQDSNALCNAGGCANVSNAENELYLIDSTGTKKTIIGRKKMVGAVVGSNDYSVGLVRMKGVDFDQNGFIDIFSCTEEFNCNPKGTFSDGEKVFPFLTRLRSNLPVGVQQTQFENKYTGLKVSLPQQSDLNVPFNINTTQFLPITPVKSNVVGLTFLINPIEDPNKAYAEDDMQEQPSVTIILTLGLNSITAKDYPGTFQPLTIQTTVAAGVIGGIQTYPPVNDFIRQNDTSWISQVLN